MLFGCWIDIFWDEFVLFTNTDLKNHVTAQPTDGCGAKEMVKTFFEHHPLMLA